MSGNDNEAGFLSRWSRRKAQSRPGGAADEPAAAADPRVAAPTVVETPEAVAAPARPVPETALPAATDAAAAEQNSKPRPPPTLADVAALTRESDYSRFVALDVSGEVKNAALKKLFANPQFNVMDGLDVYIDDYSKADPLPASIARQLVQAAFLGLVEPPQVGPENPAAADQPAAAIDPPRALEPADAHRESCAANAETDENADLRLQSHDASGCGGAEDRAAADGRSQH